MSKSKFLELTGLWERKKADGSVFLSGTLGRLRVNVFPNRVDTSGAPQWNLVLSPLTAEEIAENENPGRKKRYPF